MADKKTKIVKINEEKLVDLIHNLVEATIAERNLVPAEPKTKKVTVTESQLKALKEKGVKILSEKKKS
jgi:hypothetical protein